MRKPGYIEGAKGMAGFLDGMRTHLVYIAFIAGCRDLKKQKNKKQTPQEVVTLSLLWRSFTSLGSVNG